MAVQASFPLFYGNDNSDGGEWMEGGLLLPSDIYQSCQPHQQPQQQQLQQQMVSPFPPPPNPPTANGLPSPLALINRPLAMDLSGSLSDLMDKQRNETDRYLRLQSNRLRAALQQQQKQHLASLLRSVETKSLILLKQREDELGRAKMRSLELQACLRLSEAEKEAWQRKARDNEAAAASLSHALDRFRGPCHSAAAALPPEEEDVASCSGFPMGRGGEPTTGMARCRACGSRDACVVLLPCRHLCSCRPCAASLEACPLCASVKRGSVVVFMA